MKNRTIYHVYTEVFGEYDFFFDEDGDELAHWCRNDTSWSHEYMDPLLKKLGYNIKRPEQLSKKIANQIECILMEDGATKEDTKPLWE